MRRLAAGGWWLEGYTPDFAPVPPLLRRASRGAIVPRPRNDGGRRSSYRAAGGNLEGSCLQLLRGVVVDGWFSVLSACQPKALQATPLQAMGEAELFSGGCYDGALQRQPLF